MRIACRFRGQNRSRSKPLLDEHHWRVSQKIPPGRSPGGRRPTVEEATGRRSTQVPQSCERHAVGVTATWNRPSPRRDGFAAMCSHARRSGMARQRCAQVPACRRAGLWRGDLGSPNRPSYRSYPPTSTAVVRASHGDDLQACRQPKTGLRAICASPARGQPNNPAQEEGWDRRQSIGEPVRRADPTCHSSKSVGGCQERGVRNSALNASFAEK